MDAALTAETTPAPVATALVPPADLPLIAELRRRHRTGIPIPATATTTATAATTMALRQARRLGDGPAARPAEAGQAQRDEQVTTEVVPDVDLDGATCPIPGFLRGGAATCPVLPGAPAAPVERSRADRFVRRLLRISDAPRNTSDRATYQAFRRSMTISAIRCTLTYVVFPFVLPGISFLKGVGPLVGVVIGSIALVCDTFTIRRFFAVDHKYRWYFSAVAFSIMCLLTVLLVEDLGHVIGNALS